MKLERGEARGGARCFCREGLFERGSCEFGEVGFGPDACDVVEVMGIGRTRDGVVLDAREPDGFIGGARKFDRIEAIIWNGAEA